MAHSGLHWIDVIYNWCIHLLVDSAKILGITYEEINVWLFVIAWPVVTVGLMAAVIWLLKENARLKALCLALRKAEASKG